MHNRPLLNKDDAFWNRFLNAQDAGLDRETCIKVAFMDMSLDEALGDMDMDMESEFDPNFVLTEEPEVDDDDYIPW